MGLGSASEIKAHRRWLLRGCLAMCRLAMCRLAAISGSCCCHQGRPLAERKDTSTRPGSSLDAQTDSNDFAVADAPRDGEVRHVGSTGAELGSLDKAPRRLLSLGKPVRLRELAPHPRAGLALRGGRALVDRPA